MILEPSCSRSELIESYKDVRRKTEELCAPLQTEDYVIQSMEDVSPPKWHMGHTTWFFETFLLQNYSSDYQPYHPLYGYLFNSYYETVGDRVARANRGFLSRPTVKEIYEFRARINGRMAELIQSVSSQDWNQFFFLVDLGLNHEQQHQELLLTDIKNILAINPLKPVYKEALPSQKPNPLPPARFIEFKGGIFDIGYDGPGFSFDNERPRHRVLLNDFQLQNRAITNGEYLEFMKDKGYFDFRHWLSEGWAIVSQRNWKSPMYWEKLDEEWYLMTLSGMRKLDLNEPVCHVSYFEADAYARWAGKRLPTESEWEHASGFAGTDLSQRNFMDSSRFHPAPYRFSNGDASSLHLFGDVWEWTSSAYLPYPGFRPEAGVISEYNGKFMSNQMVLRGGSCATPRNHIRPTYRNFFQCDKRWQFTGFRLASDIEK
jgi:ergothioneine biosynthesis protein EgtB